MSRTYPSEVAGPSLRPQEADNFRGENIGTARGRSAVTLLAIMQHNRADHVAGCQRIGREGDWTLR